MSLCLILLGAVLIINGNPMGLVFFLIGCLMKIGEK